MKSFGITIKLLVAFGLIFSAFFACSKLRKSVKEELGAELSWQRPKKELREDPYYQAFLKWTRSKKVIEKLDTKAIINATYRSEEFRRIYVDKLSWDFQMLETEKKETLEAEMADNEKFVEFFLAAYTPDRKWNDFDRDKELWRVYLKNDKGMRIEPVSIKRQKKRRRFLLQNMYPYLTSFHTPYIVRFENNVEGRPFISDDTKEITLEFKSFIAKIELTWELIEDLPVSKN